MKYRSDIDGLRALAVLMVVIYHFKKNIGFSGFMGVDIFFVISGFLITGIIYEEILKNSFSIKVFYERRIRRIFPAYLAVIFLTTLTASFLFLPQELSPFAKSTFSSLFFSSNILFYTEAGYFDASGDLKPLLHTWSLSVEEQFYIFFPLLLWGLVRWKQASLKGVIIGLLGLSFASSLAYEHYGEDKSAAFYMFPLRAWELLAGSILALGILPARRMAPWQLNLLSGAGLALIVTGVSIRDTSMLYALQVLPVILGTVLLIYAGQERCSRVSGMVLGNPVAIFFGKISYSLYLWHWPIYVFARYYNFGEVQGAARLALIAVTILISYFSWRYIEQPFRKGPRSEIFGRSNLRLAALVLSPVLLVNAYIWSTEGKTFLHSAELYQTINAHLARPYAPVELQMGSPPTQEMAHLIGKVGRAEDATVLLWGDSHAVAISPAIDTKAKLAEQTGIMMNNNCLIGSKFLKDENGKIVECGDQTDRQISYIRSHPEIKTVILAQRWLERTADLYWLYHVPMADYLRLRKESLISLIEEIKAPGRQIIIFGEVPLVKVKEQNLPSIYARMLLFAPDRLKELPPSLESYLSEQKPVFAMFAELQDKYGVRLVWPHTALCQSDRCSIIDDQGIFYWDDDHLSTHGAEKLTYLFDPYFPAKAGEK